MFSTRLTRHLSTQAGPRPFPLSYGVGIDIAQISRFEAIITTKPVEKLPAYRLIPLPNHIDKTGEILNPVLRYFIRKVFSYEEWPRLEDYLRTYIEAPNDPNLASLARYLAGRWAIKEAATKAHSHRRLFYRDIVVLRQGDLGASINAAAPLVLIKPPKPQVFMTNAVASKRGLWSYDSSTTRWRPVRSKMHELQTARVSLSHDGGFVAAVVYALDEAGAEQSLDSVTDDGQGDPVHEPLIGDFLGDAIEGDYFL